MSTSRRDHGTGDNAYLAGTGQPGAVAQDVSRTDQRDRQDGAAALNSRLEGAHLKWPQPIVRSKGSFSKDVLRVARLESFCNSVAVRCCVQGILPAYSQVTTFSNERSDERPGCRFPFCDKT